MNKLRKKNFINGKLFLSRHCVFSCFRFSPPQGAKILDSLFSLPLGNLIKLDLMKARKKDESLAKSFSTLLNRLWFHKFSFSFCCLYPLQSSPANLNPFNKPNKVWILESKQNIQATLNYVNWMGKSDEGEQVKMW